MKLASSPLLEKFEVCGSNLVKFQLFKEEVVLERPCHISIAVLDISKALMYGYYYLVLKAHFQQRIKLLYTVITHF